MKKEFKEYFGVISNPYMGFTSFQHFRGEKLYSDRITGRYGQIAGCETEDYECYPVPSGVKENGREEGYHPDTTVAYIRVLWKEFEPKRGEYNYAFIEDILKRAREHGQTVMFRLMPHSTCERDDVPDWLKEIMPCPKRPHGMRVKESPTDPEYLRLFARAIEKIGERFDGDDTLDIMDVSLGGSWGEGHQDLDEYETKALMDTYIRCFPNTKLLGQMGNPDMLNYISERREIGWRADGTGSPKHMNEIYPDRFSKIKKEHWKTSPISFESYWWISEWYRQGWDIDKIIDTMLGYHITTFNNKSFPIQYEIQGKIERMLNKMGYRFVLRSADMPEEMARGGKYTVALKIENIGVAPMYNELPVTLRLKRGESELIFTSDSKVTGWLPGECGADFSVEIPSGIDIGEWEMALAIGGGEKPFVTLANEIERDGAYHTVGKVIID